MWNLIIGAAFILMGLTGKFAMRGTNSPLALSGLGVVLVGVGIFQMTREKAPPARARRPVRRLRRREKEDGTEDAGQDAGPGAGPGASPGPSPPRPRFPRPPRRR